MAEIHIQLSLPALHYQVTARQVSMRMWSALTFPYKQLVLAKNTFSLH